MSQARNTGGGGGGDSNDPPPRVTKGPLGKNEK